jgi:hypothetical protein
MTKLLLVLALVVLLVSPAPIRGFHFWPGAQLDTSRVAWAPSLGGQMDQPNPAQALAIAEAAAAAERAEEAVYCQDDDERRFWELLER